MSERKIIHIDMDAFFASVEQRDHPELKGKPIAVGGTSGRSVISTASYEARKYGVHSAMSTAHAKSLYPQLIIMPVNFDAYNKVSNEIHRIFHDYTDLTEPISCDEAFLDVTENKKGIPMAIDIAKEIKQRIKNELHLTASAGISYNKFLAKVASDYKKPDGLFSIHPAIAIDFISKLPVEDFWGVGKVTAQRMHQLGIHNGEDLRQWSQHELTLEFGKAGKTFYDFARGIDNRPVITDWDRQSVGCERTFEKDITHHVAFTVELYHVVEQLLIRLEENNFVGYTLTLKIKYNDFQQITRSLTCEKPFTDTKTILSVAKALAKDIDYTTHPVRLIGLSVSNKKNIKDRQLNLF